MYGVPLETHSTEPVYPKLLTPTSFGQVSHLVTNLIQQITTHLLK